MSNSVNVIQASTACNLQLETWNSKLETRNSQDKPCHTCQPVIDALCSPILLFCNVLLGL
jgi:hypothetical protein